MRLLGIGWFVLVGAVLGGCKAERARVTNVSVPTPPSAWLAAQQTAGTLPSPLDGWVLGSAGPAIGSACERDSGPSQAASTGDRLFCGTSGRIAVEQRQSAVMPGETIPCEWHTRGPAQVTDSRSFCVSGDHVVIVWTCYACRAINSGEVIHAKPSDMTIMQHQWLSQRLGLEAGTGPTSLDGWRELAARSPRSGD